MIPIRLNTDIPPRAVAGQPRTVDFRHPCSCYQESIRILGSSLFFHGEKQDTECDGWRRLLELIERAADEEREKFDPLENLTLQERRQIVTLPPSIAKLKHVRNFNLYDSNLVRLPPEIGDMVNLETFIPYTSYRLHWFPYEITRCKKLMRSLVSTRALYGNLQTGPPFPRLQPKGLPKDFSVNELRPEIWGADRIQDCSVCGRLIDGAQLSQVWISLRVATDVLPLLVNACSEECIHQLPVPAHRYVPVPHKGGPDAELPPTHT